MSAMHRWAAVSVVLGRPWVLLTLLAALVCGPAHARWLPEALMRHSVPAWVIDPADGTILEANAAAVELYGYPDMALGRVNIQQINQLSEAEIRAEMARAQQEKRGYFLFPHRLASGEVVTVEVHSSPIPGPQGRVLLLSLLLPESRSVTLERELQRYQTRLENLVAQRTDQLLSAERKRARMLMMALGASALATLVLLVLLRQLRLGNQRQRELATQLQDVLRGARLGLAQWDLQRDRIALDDRLGRLLGLEGDTPAWRAAELVERLHPGDVPALRQALVDHLKGKTEAADLRFRVRHSDGHWLWLQVWGRVTARDPATGRALRLAGVVRDVSSQVALEESRAIALSVFQDAGEAIVVTDERGVVLEANEAMLQLSGYSREELIGRGRLPWRPADRLGSLTWARVQRTLLREGRWRGEAWWRHRDGREIPVVETISAVRDA